MKRKKQRGFRPGDIVKLVRPIPGLPKGGYFRVKDTRPPFLELSVGSIVTGVPLEASGFFKPANGQHPDWDEEEISFQRALCAFLEKMGTRCPHCEEALKKKEAAMSQRLLQ